MNNQSNNSSKFYNNINNNNIINNDMVKRKKETPPAKPPPPILPKPKFILPQNSASSLILQRNLKAKSELNIAPGQDSNPTVATNTANTSVQSNKNDELIVVDQKQLATTNSNSNKPHSAIKINSSLVSNSQGYHSDTWESHSSRQSFDTDSTNPPHPASRYKHFNKLTSKLAAESKIAKINNNVSNNGSTSDGSITGSGTDDTDSIPNCINMEMDQSSSVVHKNILCNV